MRSRQIEKLESLIQNRAPPDFKNISSSPKMLKSALFGRKKTAAGREKSFGDFYDEWLNNLSTTLLPQLRRVLPALPSSPALVSMQVEAIHQHFISYYEALDEAAASDVGQCLYPEWRNSLEKPFLWLGDVHPYLLTNLLRSFLDDDNNNNNNNNDQDSSSSSSSQELLLDERSTDYDHSEDGDGDDDELAPECLKKFVEGMWQCRRDEKGWRKPSKILTRRVDQIECGLRLMVPALTARAREAQWKLARSVGASWWGEGEGADKDKDKKRRRRIKSAVEEGVAAVLEELVGVVVDANRMRRSVLADVLSVTSLYQGASFLEALSQFLLGFRDEKLVRDFHTCCHIINPIIINNNNSSSSSSSS